ncbi:3-hydroxyanthranilic acid dioxygenase [Endogone sp. FLAS-F59071]|nr:3-hydroxyanthranilic acid dioxygenase [Endogone sp. FLAS-F59071]|eukprot:RUS22313.1 3-hydroxyanthranilic acid dioxygenase [Endogone sp. FLAS-F59071]
MPLTEPINFIGWVRENEHLLKPPVNNFVLQRGDFLVMALGGPNKRTDYHVNETESLFLREYNEYASVQEWFYMHKGDMLLKVVDDDEFKDLPICEGEMFLLPGNTPHNPVRFANTIGIVIERKRDPHHIDRLRWYCSNCREIVYEESFHCTDLGTQLVPIINRFAQDEALRTCKNCGTVNVAK